MQEVFTKVQGNDFLGVEPLLLQETSFRFSSLLYDLSCLGSLLPLSQNGACSSVKRYLLARIILAVIMIITAAAGMHTWYPVGGLPIWRQVLLHLLLIVLYPVLYQPAVEMSGEALAMQTLAEVEGQAMALKNR